MKTERTYLQTPWAHDHKSENFRTSRLPSYGTVNIATLPESLNRPLTAPYDQGNTQRCAAYAAAKNGELMHGIPCSPDWQTDKIGRLQGRPVDINGSDPNAAMDSQLFDKQGGHLPQTDWNPANNPQEYDVTAMDFSSRDYTKPDQGQDVFDSIKIGLYLHYDFDTKLGAAVQLFIPWYDSFNQENIVAVSGQLLGYHSIVVDDFGDINGQQVLYFYNSYGTDISPTGRQTMNRAVVNSILTQYGTTWKQPDELTPEQAAAAKQSTPTGEIWRQILNLWYMLIIKFWYGLAH